MAGDAERGDSAYTDVHPLTNSPFEGSVMTLSSKWLRPLAFLLLLAPVASQSQARRRCPQFARVPGYGACTNISGSSCGFCTYRCNDDTVVRWNVCGG